jgi:hypothetical protein
MEKLALLSDAELLARLPAFVSRERVAAADVIEYLIEIDRRRLYLEQAVPSLYAFCTERHGYSEDEALKRIRVARLGAQLPQVLDELRRGAIHLSGLVMLAPHLTEENAGALLTEARGASRRKLRQILARWFPRPDVRATVRPLALSAGVTGTLPGTDPSGPSSQSTRSGAYSSMPRPNLEPLSAERYRVEFTASAGLYAKLERATELLSHSVPRGDLPDIFERALDALIERELKRRTGAGKPRKLRAQKPGSRHVPLHVERVVRERDGDQCTFTDAEGRRCQERRFLTLEHRIPFARGGPPTVENLCLLCKSHNFHTAHEAFGEAFIAEKQAQHSGRTAPIVPQTPDTPDIYDKVLFALCKLGFRERQVRPVLTTLRREQGPTHAEPLLRAALGRLTPST